MKVKNWTYDYCGSIANDWREAAEQIASEMPCNIELPEDLDLQAEFIQTQINIIAASYGYDLNYWPETLSIVPIFEVKNDKRTN